MQKSGVLECLTEVVGLSPVTDSCFDTGKPTGANNTESGKYISELLKLKWAQGATDQEVGNLWDILVSARNDGIQQFIQDYAQMITTRKDQRFLPFEGFVADNQFNTSLNPASSFQAIQLEPFECKGAFMAVTGVQLALDNITTPVNVDVSIYSSRDLTTAIATTTVTLTAVNKFFSAQFANAVKLDFSRVDQGDKYWFVYELPAGAKTKNNLIENDCGCGSKRGRIDKNRFLQFGLWRSTEATSIADLGTGTTNLGSNAKGLRIESSASCDFFSFLCNLSTSVNEITTSINSGNNIALGMGMAQIIQYSCAIKAAQTIVDSTNINRITALKKEHLWGKIASWKKQYLSWVKWFADEVPSHVNDCFVCKRDRSLSINSILA
jgi:hypothetical protein